MKAILLSIQMLIVFRYDKPDNIKNRPGQDEDHAQCRDMPAFRDYAATEFGNPVLRCDKAAYEHTEPDIKEKCYMKMVFNEIDQFF